MDLPRAEMTKEQRIALVEWEKKLAELADDAAKQARQLESERKLLEMECADIIVEFNGRLASLSYAKVGIRSIFVAFDIKRDGDPNAFGSLSPRDHLQVKIDVECRALELQALTAAAQVDAVLHTEARRRHYEAVLPTVIALKVRLAR